MKRPALLYPCDICSQGFEQGHLLCVDGRQICAACWVAAGRPWPRLQHETPPQERAQAEIQIRQRMIEHGGPFANAVRNGKT